VAGERIRIRGLVQGVGFRPTVWRIATELGIAGEVLNDGSGVLVRAWADTSAIDRFCQRLLEECPPLARIDGMERSLLADDAPPPDFRITASDASAVRTGVVPDAATCPACRDEIFDPGNRRHRYPFTNCTHCGPRLSIVRRIPYDRANTSMAAFVMCPDCQAEYDNPSDRRFHAQPNACPACGPRVWLANPDGSDLPPAEGDALSQASRLLGEGRILAVKGIGGFHLACDATNAEAVDELRRRKRRYAKPFALMARDLDVIRHYAVLEADDAGLLASPAAPIVLLTRRPEAALPLADGVAPGQATLGFMLPYSPLHHLLLADWERPLVMTSGNLSDEPQCIGNDDAHRRLGAIADYLLLHDRPIVNRVDDSVVRMMDGAPRLLRRARGYAPASLPLPPGLEDAPPILALGGELKNTLCLVKDGQAAVSQHLGDLEDARTANEFERAVALYRDIYGLAPALLAVDRHPDYRSTQYGQRLAADADIPIVAIQHHHAHVAAVLAESGWPAGEGPVLGLALDGLGYGEDGTVWGGEFLLADYGGFTRVGSLAPAPLPGGNKAMVEPWRNAWAHLATHLGWDRCVDRWGGTELVSWLQEQPIATLAQMAARGVNSPLSSSSGRLFDAVAAAVGIHRESISYEGQAAIELEAAADRAPGGAGAYPFSVGDEGGLARLDPAPMWAALMDDLSAGMEPAVVAARFHRGLADALCKLAFDLAHRHHLGTVALSGGVFQNRTLFEAVCDGLRQRDLAVLSHRAVPANDGGLALGQAAAAAARWLAAART
jgi:hydrogenase maturation protein HypF